MLRTYAEALTYLCSEKFVGFRKNSKVDIHFNPALSRFHKTESALFLVAVKGGTNTAPRRCLMFGAAADEHGGRAKVRSNETAGRCAELFVCR